MAVDNDKAVLSKLKQELKDARDDNKTLVTRLTEVKEFKDKEINALKESLQALQGKLDEEQPDTLYTAKTFDCDTKLGRYISTLAGQLAGCAETIQRAHLDPLQKADKYALKAAVDSLQEALTHAEKAYK